MFTARTKELEQVRRARVEGVEVSRVAVASSTSLEQDPLDALLSADDFQSLASGADRSLGPGVEDALLSALIALGVMHTPNEQVLVLPMQSEALREVVFFRYVGSAEEQERCVFLSMSGRGAKELCGPHS